ncbi:hypothetical protein COW99_02525 [Candidatus Roizmanbacteria bacterium CG22_combo_CG10-13_8_21_14_all_38_20]|uniref:Glycosyltransferase 2-like domain-containing protein n=1 Tax=Candidatus Roizmanbacteria bacterium CG22_combo_CG10-13_8_21_14_all_38_20 TaxID=1974862 RepID=A0A2H0BVS1_9BACT|nr:glycosyltransferase family 2 protein [Candidatus Microgenomates bacterium]PIP61731.1 MAG: hypothetical protein COW99_02525 [Candidatus Roizmanbacteria bacterium CG22_combo_CG10-13_8_21_14_all_38_20]PJC32038.1 MAG: hypothetical protein CO050_00910 [Candidatus Roizmanbacteria bacterium CG_4_9_14_0_2_um_filter_38_17]
MAKLKSLVSIVIPNYNGEELLKQNLPKIAQAALAYDSTIEIIVVDDASIDNSVTQIESQRSKVKNIKLVRHEKNRGFSVAVNTGVANARGDIVVLLNSDVSPEFNFLEPLISHFTDEKIFAVGCLDKSIEGNKTIERGRGIGWWERGMVVHKRGEVNKADTFWVSGGSGAFRKYIWDKLGGMDELYKPFYWEDIDLSYRARKAGYKLLFESKSVVTHAHSDGTIKSNFSDEEIKSIAYRNQLLFVWKNITDLQLTISHIVWLPYHFLATIARGDFAFSYGFVLALFRLGIVSRQRSNYVYNDKKILNKT